jgi:hypothetical protein
MVARALNFGSNFVERVHIDATAWARRPIQLVTR